MVSETHVSLSARIYIYIDILYGDFLLKCVDVVMMATGLDMGILHHPIGEKPCGPVDSATMNEDF